MTHEDIIKLLISVLLGIILGLERELKRKPLGLKTCLTIAISSCLLTIVSVDSALTFYHDSNLFRPDPMRLAAQIVSGIGFLGAGVILRKNNDVVSGLTTAAVVWSAAGIGITVGAGFYIDAVIGTVLLILSVEFLPYVIKRFGPKRFHQKEVVLTVTVPTTEDIESTLRTLPAVESRVESIQHVEQGKSLNILCVVEYGTDIPTMYTIVERLPWVKDVSIDVL